MLIALAAMLRAYGSRLHQALRSRFLASAHPLVQA
jgi:hypothetical protein